jgi:hypothetical protein
VKYLILMGNDDAAWSSLPPAEQERVFREHQRFEAALKEQGRWVAAWRLRPGAEARTVRRNAAGKCQVEPGPALPGLHCYGGAYLIEAASLDEATDWAQRGRFIPGANEVREIWEE